MEPNLSNHIVRIQNTDSTNNYAKQQIRLKDLPEGTVFLAYEQSAGRGQLRNSWESEPGENLTFSMILYPDFLEIRHQFMISKVVTLGIYKALHEYVGQLKIKWPNDIYAGNQKLGGILIENSIMSGSIRNSVVGIGLNVNQTVFVSDAPNPVSLKLLTNEHFDCEIILTRVLTGINWYYDLLSKGDQDQINQEYIFCLYRLNEMHRFKSDSGIFSGEIIGVNEIGQLQIRTKDAKIVEFHFKEVEFLHGGY